MGDTRCVCVWVTFVCVCVCVCPEPQLSAEVQDNKPVGQNIRERADEPFLSPRKDMCGKQWKM